MKCLVLAAGAGSRLADRSGSKPLARVAGLSLIERAIVTARAAGIDELYVVCGYNSGRLVAHLDDVARRRSAVIHPVFNARYEDGNGLSVLAARALLDAEPKFGLIMADHVFDGGLLASLFAQDVAPGEAVLAIDTNLSNPAVDVADATRVELSEGRVRSIAKNLETFNAFDTGAFVCTPAVFDAIEDSVARGDTTLSGGMSVLAATGRLRAHDVTGRNWIDVDTPRDRERATRILYQRLRKPNDGFVSRRLNRPLSLHVVTPALLRAWPAITASQTSMLAFLVGVGAGLSFAIGQPVAAALLVHLSSVLDGSDGEVARLKLLESKYGGYLDAVLDRLADSVMLLGVLVYLLGSLALGAIVGVPSQVVIVAVTGAALVGTLMVSYTSTKALAEVGHRYTGALVGAGRGRDLRLLILAVGGLLAAVHPALLLGAAALIAVLTLAVVAWRMTWSAHVTRIRRPIDLGGVRAVVLDFDGTLADTMGVLFHSAVRMLRETYAMSTEEARSAYRRTIGMTFAGQLEQIAPGDPRNGELVRRFETAKQAQVPKCQPFADALDLIADLNGLGIGAFVCSSTSADIVVRFCADAGILDLVARVSGVEQGRTKLDQLQDVVEAAGFPSDQLLFIGDSPYDATLASRIGIRFVGVSRLFTAEEFASAGVPSVANLSELRPLIVAARARRQMLTQQVSDQPDLRC